MHRSTPLGIHSIGSRRHVNCPENLSWPAATSQLHLCTCVKTPVRRHLRPLHYSGHHASWYIDPEDSSSDQTRPVQPLPLAPTRVVDTCLNIVQSGNLDQLLGILHSDELVLDDRIVAPDLAHSLVVSSDSSLQQLLEAMEQHSPALHLLDSYAIRTLVLQKPRLIQKLSGLWLGPGRYIQRVLVQSPSGEESVLTLTIVKQSRAKSELDNTDRSSLASTSPPRAPSSTTSSPPRAPSSAPPTSCSRTISWWSLSSIKGEPLHPAPPSTLSPEFGPESIVKAQVDALRRGDLRQAYALLSPSSQHQLGGLERFASKMLSKRSGYRELVGHSHASSVRRHQTGRDTYLEMVMIEGTLGRRGLSESTEAAGKEGGLEEGGVSQQHLWCWLLKLQPSRVGSKEEVPWGQGGSRGEGQTGGAEAQGQVQAGCVEDCWTIDSVVRVQEDAL